MSNHTTIRQIRLFAGVVGLALSVAITAEEAKSIKYGTASGPTGTFSS